MAQQGEAAKQGQKPGRGRMYKGSECVGGWGGGGGIGGQWLQERLGLGYG